MEKGDVECLNGWRTEWVKGVGESEVAGDRESEICSVRKDVAGVVGAG